MSYRKHKRVGLTEDRQSQEIVKLNWLIWPKRDGGQYFLAARASQAHVKLRKAELRPAEPAEAGTYRSEQIWIYGNHFFET